MIACRKTTVADKAAAVILGEGMIKVIDWLSRIDSSNRTRLQAGVAYSVLPARSHKRKPLLLLWALNVLSLAILAPSPVSAESARGYWPEVEGHFGLSDDTRLVLKAKEEITDAQTVPGSDPESRTGQVGANLDFTLKPILRTGLREEDWERNRYLWTRIGYSYVGRGEGFSGGENRVTLEANAEEPFDTFSLRLRVKWEMRDIDGSYSNRYAVRLGVEKELTVAGKQWVPYVDAEAFYDTRYDVWNRQLYRTGVEVVLNPRWRIEPYIGYQHDSRSQPEQLSILGLIIKYKH